MGLRDIVLAVLCYGALPVIPFRPFLGLLMFSWLAYFRPQEMSWVLRSAQFSQYVAVATFAGLALGFVLPNVVPRERLATLRLQTLWMGLVWVWVFICAQFALNPGLAQRRLDLITNVVLIAVLTTGMVNTPKRFRLMITVIAFSLGALGLKFAVFGALRGGSVFTSGPGGFMVDNNAFAMCLNMAIPLLFGIALLERNGPVRLLALVLAVGSGLTIVFTLSRGGLLTLAVVGALLVWTSGKRLLSALLLTACVGGFFIFSSDDFQQRYFDRTSTITNYEQDESAMGRIEEWGTAIRISKDYPVFGVGPASLSAIYHRYSTRERLKVTHNAFLQFLVDCGYPGMLLLIGLLVATLFRLQLLQRSDVNWVRTYARMMQISLVAYVVGGSLLNAGYLDLMYHLVALSVSLEVVAEAGEPEAESVRPLVPAGTPWYLAERA